MPKSIVNGTKPLSTIQMIGIGGLGAITPIIMNLAQVDHQIFQPQNFDVFSLIGYLIKVTVMFFAGGLVVILNKEHSFVKAFQLGIIAPALLTSYTNNADLPDLDTAFFQTTAYAAEEFPLLEESKERKFFRGLGFNYKKKYYIILAIYEEKEEALRAAELFRGYDIHVMKFSVKKDGKTLYIFAQGKTKKKKKAEALKLQAQNIQQHVDLGLDLLPEPLVMKGNKKQITNQLIAR